MVLEPAVARTEPLRDYPAWLVDEPAVARTEPLRDYPAWLVNEPAVARTEPLRDYQAWLVDEATGDDGNAIIVLPTGTGKTRVAFEVICHALDRHTSRSVVFLAPNVVLVEQQHNYFRQFCQSVGRHVQIALSAGSHSQSLQGHGVLFATPAKYHDSLGITLPGFANTSLLVLDECHDAIRSQSALQGKCKPTASDHPYAQILRRYREHTQHARPKVLGLAASPGATPVDLGNLRNAISGGRYLYPSGELHESVMAVTNTPSTVVRLVSDGDMLGRMLQDIQRRAKTLQQYGDNR